jgi:hypothetical protein
MQHITCHPYQSSCVLNPDSFLIIIIIYTNIYVWGQIGEFGDFGVIFIYYFINFWGGVGFLGLWGLLYNTILNLEQGVFLDD